MYSAPEIRNGLRKVFDAVAVYGSDLSPEAFGSAPAGKWSPGQQIAHLTQSTRMVNIALRLPRIVPRLLFGKATRPSHDYDWVVTQYRGALDRGGKAPKGFDAPKAPVEKRLQVIERFERESNRMVSLLSRWPDDTLDSVRVPHPLIGKLTLREMLLFTVYHTEHHFENMRRMTEH